MKKKGSFFRSPMGTLFLFMVAALLLMTGTIGGVRAAPQILNPDFAYSGLALDQIGVTLRENGNNISSRNYNSTTQAFDATTGALFQQLLGEKEEFRIGKVYDEALSIYNSGSIPEFVRVTVYKYWVDDKGNRFDAYNAAGEDILNKLIELNFLETNGWKIDHNADTKERTVLYYQNVLNPGASTPAFTNTLKISEDAIDLAQITGNTVTWVTDGLTFQIEAEANAIQNHNARAAVKSAWGLTDNDIARLGLNLG